MLYISKTKANVQNCLFVFINNTCYFSALYLVISLVFAIIVLFRLYDTSHTISASFSRVCEYLHVYLSDENIPCIFIGTDTSTENVSDTVFRLGSLISLHVLCHGYTQLNTWFQLFSMFLISTILLGFASTKDYVRYV